MKVKIYTEMYRPFRMGGDVHQPIATEVEVTRPVDIGKNFKAWIVVTPNSRTAIVETLSGGIVGYDLETVRGDVEAGEFEMMVEQVKQGVERSKQAEMLLEEKFWKYLKCS